MSRFTLKLLAVIGLHLVVTASSLALILMHEPVTGLAVAVGCSAMLAHVK